MLARQVGSIQNPYGVSDADMLLDAAGGGDGGGGTVTPLGGGGGISPAGGPIGITPQPIDPSRDPTGLNTAPPGSGGAPAGGGVTLSPTRVPAVSLVTPGTGAPAGSDNSGILWAIAGLGGAYLLSRGGGNAVAGMLGKKGSKLLPYLVVGGLGAYLLLRKPTAAVNPAPGQSPTPTGGGGAQMAPADMQRVYILGWNMTTQASQLAVADAVPRMTDAEVATFYNFLVYLTQQPPGWNGQFPAGMQENMDAILVKYGIPSL